MPQIFLCHLAAFYVVSNTLGSCLVAALVS